MKTSVKRPLVLACLLFILAGILNGMLVHDRARRFGDTVLPRDAPPSLVFSTVVLGGFRGILADALWLRASRLQQQERFLELVQLAEWITALDPHSPEVWAFHAWNLAYNVSIMMPEPEARWYWIDEAVRLLRDEGIALNPGDPRLYFELAWLFQHKLGGTSDRMHATYKTRLAERVADLLPEGRVDYDALADSPSDQAALASALGLDWRHMRACDSAYGPLDWRVPQAHAVYWAALGVKQAGPAGYLPCSRVVYQSLADMALQERPDLIPAARRAYLATVQRHEEPSVRAAYANFLARAAVRLDAAGEGERAKALREERALLEATGMPHAHGESVE